MPEETLDMLARSIAGSVDTITELCGRPVTWSYHEGSRPKLTIDGVVTLVDLDEYTDMTWADTTLEGGAELENELIDMLHTLERVAIVAARQFVTANGGTYAD